MLDFTKNTEDVCYKNNIEEIEYIIDCVKKENNGYIAESKYFVRFVELFCETSLYLRAIMDNSKPKNERFQVYMFKSGSNEFTPVFTRKRYADNFTKHGDVFELDTKRFMVALRNLDENIIVNPNSENFLIIPKDVFKKIIFETFVKKYNAKENLEKSKDNNDELASLVCKYNISTSQIEKMQLIGMILEYMQENDAWIPCTMNYSEEDYKKLLNLKEKETFSFEKTTFKPDILKHESGQFFIPLFSRKEEAPKEYANNFSWINLPIVQVCIMAKNDKSCNGVVINPFTNSRQINDKLIDIVLNIHFGKENLVLKEQMESAKKEPNGGLKIELDDERLYFLSMFVDNGRILKYFIDKEAASDSHYELEPYAAFRLKELLENNYGFGNFVDNLRSFFSKKSDWELEALMKKNNIPYKPFHF